MKKPTTGRFGGFTLTELLVVVIVIGVLAAIVLPKFNKVLETRKTTEAEELMAAVRTEQERRCALDKNYTKNKDAVNLASLNTKNFTYALGDTGIEAVSTGKYAYTLKMPSYRDGRLCCEDAAACGHLNKDYPQCAPLTARADYESGVECKSTEAGVTPTEKTCSGSAATRSCGCLDKGTQSQTCNTSTGTWEWGSCSIDDCSQVEFPDPGHEELDPIEKCDMSEKPSASCGNCGTRSVSCQAGKWVVGEKCTQPPDAVCTPGEVDYKRGEICPPYTGFMQPKVADGTPTPIQPGSGSDTWLSGLACDNSCHWQELECAQIDDSAGSSGGSGPGGTCGEKSSMAWVHDAGSNATVCRRVCYYCGTEGCKLTFDPCL